MKLNIDGFEKEMAKNVIEVIIELSELNKLKNKTTPGNVYTSYDPLNKVIEIGYDSRYNIDFSSRSRFVKSRKGYKREVKLLEATLNELGYPSLSRKYQYKYSIRLLQHLKILGWPIPSIS